MRRFRVLLAAVLGLGVAPAPVAAQQPDDRARIANAVTQSSAPLPRVGYVALGTEEAMVDQFAAFRDGMKARGWIDGRTVVLEPRWGRGSRERIPGLVRDLIRGGVDLIVATGPTVHGARTVIGTTPMVFSFSGDPVIAGLVNSLASPGGNITGVSHMSYELNEKRLDVLREALPMVRRVALLSDPQHAGEHLELEANLRASARLGFELVHVRASNLAELDAGLIRIRQSGAQAMVVLPDATMTPNRKRIASFASAARIPMISGWAMFANAGALMTYGPNLGDSYRRLGHYVDKLLKGAKPADLPVEQPTRFELVVNLRTARALSIALPHSILLRADRVIE